MFLFVYTVNMFGNHIWHNNGFKKNFGEDKMKIINKPERFLIPPKDKEDILNELKNATAFIGVYIDEEDVYKIIQYGMDTKEGFYAAEMIRGFVCEAAFHKEDNECDEE